MVRRRHLPQPGQLRTRAPELREFRLERACVLALGHERVFVGRRIAVTLHRAGRREPVDQIEAASKLENRERVLVELLADEVTQHRRVLARALRRAIALDGHLVGAWHQIQAAGPQELLEGRLSRFTFTLAPATPWAALSTR